MCLEKSQSHLFECGNQGPTAEEARAAVASEATAASFGDSSSSQHTAVEVAEVRAMDPWLTAGVKRF